MARHVGSVMDKEKLTEVLSEFARTMVTDFPIQGILEHLVKRIVDDASVKRLAR
jgi:hypothetical protein